MVDDGGAPCPAAATQGSTARQRPCSRSADAAHPLRATCSRLAALSRCIRWRRRPGRLKPGRLPGNGRTGPGKAWTQAVRSWTACASSAAQHLDLKEQFQLSTALKVFKSLNALKSRERDQKAQRPNANPLHELASPAINSANSEHAIFRATDG